MKIRHLRLLPFAAVLFTASCTDKQYDLSDINTESRFTAKGLVIPLNLSPIKLDAIISIDNGSDIRKDDNGNYYFLKESSEEGFHSADVYVERFTINQPADISESVTVDIAMPEIINKIAEIAGDKTIGEILSNQSLSNQIGIDANTTIYNVEINDTKNINLITENIDSRITKLEKLGVEPLTVSLNVRLEGLKNVVSSVNIKNLTVGLPCGFTVIDNNHYNTQSGELKYDELAITTDGKTTIKATVSELAYAAMEEDGARFNPNEHNFKYIKPCKITGATKILAGQLNPNAKLQDIKDVTKFTYSCDVQFNKALIVNSFSGGINYKIADIAIDPVTINNLPEMLKESGTNIELGNPQLYLDITNPFFKNNITAKAGLRIIGNVPMPETAEGKVLNFDKEQNKIVLSPLNEDLVKEMMDKGYEHEGFPELKNLLSGDRVPETLNIKILNPLLNADNVKDFSLGVNHPGITGRWKFYTKLSLTENTKIAYSKEWDDWQSDDLDNLTVENATVTCTIKKDIALNADNLEFTLMGRNGELKGKTALQGDEEQEIKITMTGGPVKNIYGGKIKVNLKGQGKDLNKEQQIEISNLHVKVDGYYDKEL